MRSFLFLCDIYKRWMRSNLIAISPFLTCFPYRRSPSALCLREPTATAWRGTTLGTHIEKYRSLVMPLVHGRKEFQLARSLVLFAKLDAPLARRLAARVPSSNGQIPLISRLRMSER